MILMKKDEDSVRAKFVIAFKEVACANPKKSLANIIQEIMNGKGCFSFRTDLEVVIELSAFCGYEFGAEKFLISGLSGDNSKMNLRSCEQSDIFSKMLENALQRNPGMKIGELLSSIAMDRSYCSYYEDEELLEKIEKM